MKHIVKVNNIQEAKDNPIRPIIALDNSGILFFEGTKVVPEGFVDFGLPSGTLWSTKNIGATNEDTAESWYGGYYAWGETETKNDYVKDSYKYADGAQYKLTKYCNNTEYGNEGYTDQLTRLVPEDDVATVINSAWRMPTKEDFDELLAGTTNSWVTDYKGISGLNGRLFTGNNGNSLFIPAAGYYYASFVETAGSYCYLWSSSLDLFYPSYACNLYFNSDNVNISNFNRYIGCSIRPILY